MRKEPWQSMGTLWPTTKFRTEPLSHISACECAILCWKKFLCIMACYGHKRRQTCVWLPSYHTEHHWSILKQRFYEAVHISSEHWQFPRLTATLGQRGPTFWSSLKENQGVWFLSQGRGMRTPSRECEDYTKLWTQFTVRNSVNSSTNQTSNKDTPRLFCLGWHLMNTSSSKETQARHPAQEWCCGDDDRTTRPANVIVLQQIKHETSCVCNLSPTQRNIVNGFHFCGHFFSLQHVD